MENHSSNGLFVVQSKTFVTLFESLDVSFFLFTSNGNVLDWAKSLTQRCCLFLMLWKNANHSLLDSIFYSKPSKCTQDLDCPLSFLEQFLIQIPRYKLFTYSINNDFKLLPGRVNFVIVLYHSLYVTLTALTTDIVSIIQQASFGGVDSQDLLTSIRCTEMMF